MRLDALEALKCDRTARNVDEWLDGILKRLDAIEGHPALSVPPLESPVPAPAGEMATPARDAEGDCYTTRWLREVREMVAAGNTDAALFRIDAMLAKAPAPPPRAKPEPATGWRDAEREKPDGRAILRSNTGFIATGCYRNDPDAMAGDNKGWFWDSWQPVIGVVTHWMPLPAPPPRGAAERPDPGAKLADGVIAMRDAHLSAGSAYEAIGDAETAARARAIGNMLAALARTGKAMPVIDLPGEPLDGAAPAPGDDGGRREGELREEAERVAKDLFDRWDERGTFESAPSWRDEVAKVLPELTDALAAFARADAPVQPGAVNARATDGEEGGR